MNKKLLSASMALALGICTLATSTPVYAWGGYTHHYMAMKKSEGFLHAPKYRGGALFADIGRLSWDSKYTVSDSAAFANEIRRIAGNTNNLGAIAFADGWQAHIVQDTNQTIDLARIQTTRYTNTNYTDRKAWVDEYVRDVLDVDHTGITVYYDLIRSTYSSLNNFSPTNAQIDTEYVKMMAAFDALIGQVWGSYSDAEKSSINQVLQDVINRTSVFYSSNSLVKSSISYASIYEDQGAVSADNETSKTKNQKLDKLKKEKLKKSCNQVLDEIINEKLATLEKEYISDDVYNITYKIQDHEKYKNKLTKLRNIAEENTTTLEEILE